MLSEDNLLICPNDLDLFRLSVWDSEQNEKGQNARFRQVNLQPFITCESQSKPDIKDAATYIWAPYFLVCSVAPPIHLHGTLSSLEGDGLPPPVRFQLFADGRALEGLSTPDLT